MQRFKTLGGKGKREMLHFTQVGGKAEKRDTALYVGAWERRWKREMQHFISVDKKGENRGASF